MISLKSDAGSGSALHLLLFLGPCIKEMAEPDATGKRKRGSAKTGKARSVIVTSYHNPYLPAQWVQVRRTRNAD